MNTAGQFHVDQVSPSYWRVTFDNGPVNLLDPDTVDQLGALIGRIEDDPDLTVVVFRSDKPGYFMAHWDFLADNARVAGMRPGPAVLGQFEVGVGAVPGGGPMTRLGRLVGRAAPWRSCSAAMTSRPAWRPNTAT
jgi:enoyl-CoA hydratase/carnithine racemase